MTYFRTALRVSVIIAICSLLTGCRPPNLPPMTQVQGVPVRLMDDAAPDWTHMEDVLLAVRLGVEEDYEVLAPRIMKTEVWVYSDLDLQGFVDDYVRVHLNIRAKDADFPMVLIHLYAWHLIPHATDRGWNAAHNLDQTEFENLMRMHLSSVLGQAAPVPSLMPKECPTP